ncbi:thiamine pyrophosphate enzyme, N-terminal TPP binding domain-containing protein [Mycena polygramma]|nr:thiamine pyrophosphate enzyme, N-terminal TPP binding domain-containing protein [Mycena polygramma]
MTAPKRATISHADPPSFPPCSGLLHMYTTSSVFLQSLANAGITHVFANWGSDHPALLEDLQRQRAEKDGQTASKIITCPNEMVALTAAQGFAQVTGKPAAVIVHVDVGTQAMAGAIHNVDRGRIPVLIYAGASPFSSLGEMKGGRNEWIMSIQDIPDQAAIVRQYMRSTSQIESGKVTTQVVHRALQIATSHPKGPVYVWARREVMEEEVELSAVTSSVSLRKWPSVEPAALSATAANAIALALAQARAPLIITSHAGRNHDAVPLLSTLSTTLAIPVVAVCPSAVSLPFSHPHFLGTTYLSGSTHTHHLATADVILVLDADVPWIPGIQPPHPDARVFIVDSGDPLKTISAVGQWHVDAEMMCNADIVLALEGINVAVGMHLAKSDANLIEERRIALMVEHDERVRSLDRLEDAWSQDLQDGRATLPNVLGVLRRTIAQQAPSHNLDKTLVLNEGVSNYPRVWEHMRTEVAGGQLTSGGASLGWSLAAAIGAHMGGKNYDLIVSIVGDGSFMFCVPSSAFWIARRYDTPFLTIVINNGGWRAPKLSMLGCHPTGYGSHAAGSELSVGFGPHLPDYSQIAVAASAGWVWGKRVGGDGGNVKEALSAAMAEAVRVVLEERRCAVLDCVLESI